LKESVILLIGALVGILSCTVFPFSIDNGNVEGTGQNASEVGNDILENTKRAADKIRELAGLPDEDTTTENSSSASDNQSANIVLLSHKLKKGEGNYNNVIGQVKNVGNDTLEYVKIGVNVYDKNGDLIGTDSAYAESSTLEPNQKSSFDITSSNDNFEGMDSYELFLSWQNSDGIDRYVDDAQIIKQK